MNILALDLGTRTGYALSNTNNIAGTWNLAPRQHEDSGMRLLKFRASLLDVLVRCRIDLVVYEDAAFQPGGNRTAQIFGELVGILKVTCKDKGIAYTGVNASTIKKHATGKGNASKEAMRDAAHRKWPGFAGDDNEADARWLLHYARQEWATTTDFETLQALHGGPTTE